VNGVTNKASAETVRRVRAAVEELGDQLGVAGVVLDVEMLAQARHRLREDGAGDEDGWAGHAGLLLQRNQMKVMMTNKGIRMQPLQAM
jgi:hypothetical protein